MRQFEESRQERTRRHGRGQRAIGPVRPAAEASRWNILRAESEIAELYLRKEAFAARDGPARSTVARPLQRKRTELAAEAAKNPRQDSQARRANSRRRTWPPTKFATSGARLADRLREDYGIELAESGARSPATKSSIEREEVQQEIDDLRQKINNLGNVNLEALDELEQLEARHRTLSGQFKDLSDAKASLEKIIEKINADSRRLFAETLETVRGAFPDAVPRPVRRRPGRHRPGGERRYSGQRHRDRRPAARQGAAEHFAA